MAQLTTARWDISTLCNLNCLHCCAEGLFKDRSNTLSLELAISLLNKLKQNGIVNLNILGKEPFLYPYIKDILQYACDQGFRVDITTNGTVIKDQDIAFLVNLGLRSIFFSIDGSSPIVNDVIRGEGVFYRALATMQKVIAEKRNQKSTLKVNVNTVLTKINAKDISAIIDLCDSIGVDGFNLSHLNEVGNAVVVSDRILLSPTEEFKVVEEVMKEIPKYPKLRFNILSSKPKFLEYLYKKYKVIFPVSVSGCKACIREIYIDPLGHIAPCLSTYEGFFGISHENKQIEEYKVNIFELGCVPFSKIPFYKEFKHAFPLIKKTYKNYIPCNSCPYLTNICFPCPLGSLNGFYTEDLCFIADTKLKEMDLQNGTK